LISNMKFRADQFLAAAITEILLGQHKPLISLTFLQITR
jgi:hypothetical protein